GRWVPLSLRKSEILRSNFSSELEMLIRAREAAQLAGGSALGRPEDIEWDPITGAAYVCLTASGKQGLVEIAKFSEEDKNPLALNFKYESWKTGGEEIGFVNPDNLCFDPHGNLWMTNDTKEIDPNSKLGNNSLFVIPMKGVNQGHVIRVASAPM